MYKNLKLVLFFIGSMSCYSQNADIKSIRFHYLSSVVIGREIEVNISQTNKAAMVEIKSQNRNTKTAITTQKYSELCIALLKIEPKDILQNVRNCLDGDDITINFGGFSNSVEYSINCLTEDDDKTVYKDFLDSVKLILEIAKLKISDIK